eukprot:COSAG02_NODE_45821_length_354_cov_0.407843_1_plen_44_part_00
MGSEKGWGVGGMGGREGMEGGGEVAVRGWLAQQRRQQQCTEEE